VAVYSSRAPCLNRDRGLRPFWRMFGDGSWHATVLAGGDSVVSAAGQVWIVTRQRVDSDMEWDMANNNSFSPGHPSGVSAGSIFVAPAGI